MEKNKDLALLKYAQSKGIAVFDGGERAEQTYTRFFQDALPTLTPNNVGVPANFLVDVMKEAVKVLVAPNNADAVIGARKKLLDWEKEAHEIPLIEGTGETHPYSDFSNARYVGVNVNYKRVNHYRFETGILVGDLLEKQYSLIGINLVSEMNYTAGEILAKQYNNISFNGWYVNDKLFVTGILNDPELLPYETIAKSWDQCTYDEIMADMARLLAKLSKQSGGNVKLRQDKIRLSLPETKLNYLNMTQNLMGRTILEALKIQYPNIEFVGASELSEAYTGNKDVLVLIAENGLGGLRDTANQGYSQIGMLSRVVDKETARTQKMMSGTTGFVAYKPTYIIRAQGV